MSRNSLLEVGAKSEIISDFAPTSSKEFLDIQATIECGFTLKRIRDMIRTYSQIKSTLTQSFFDYACCFVKILRAFLFAFHFDKEMAEVSCSQKGK